ncbi:MAG: glycosyltransferase family 4 protein [Eubacterium sp.]|nr:glycosyltransferase family 4 protein [Eubacterium sp.]
MEKKKICFIAQFPPPIHGLSKAVDTLYNSDLNASLSSKGEFEFEKIDITDNKKFLQNLNRIRKSKGDLFYFTISQTKGGNLRDLIIFKLLEIQHKKCLIHLHGGYYRTLIDKDINRWQKKSNYKAIRKLAGAIVLGPSLEYIFRGILPEERIYTVFNCVDDQYLMSDEEFEKKTQKIRDKKVKQVLYLSNFIRSKGYFQVLEIARLEKETVDKGKEKNLHFHFAGGFFHEADKKIFEDYIKTNNLKDFVTCHGVVDGISKQNLLKSCDVFILPTRYPNEGQPISILEAMANAMMIVSTDHAGIPDIVQDNRNGIMIRQDNTAKMIYEKLSSVNNAQLVEFCSRNRYYSNDHFTQKIYVNAMKKVFKSLV